MRAPLEHLVRKGLASVHIASRSGKRYLVPTILILVWGSLLLANPHAFAQDKEVSERANRAIAYEKVADTLRFLVSEQFRRRENLWNIARRGKNEFIHSVMLLRGNEYYIVVGADTEDKTLDVTLHNGAGSPMTLPTVIEGGKAILYFQPKSSAQYYVRIRARDAAGVEAPAQAFAMGYAYR